ncbi:hypothetical protein NKR23_g1112 [Pleurostoma richardsiae]|uniref:AB hydrolase-1 domain-containing protein n=1 Tax=Pleurostoma richardsiae TaxID=41990 RepID=A0AA38RTM6_9PEZI|nr:hypothetical protein NKR23_g1112 [Pleurostoma richardsiae]
MDNSIATQGSALAPDTLVASTSEASPAPQPSQRAAEAAAYLDQSRFHCRLTVPATDDHGLLTVTYAVAGAQSNSAHTVLFIGGMMGTRYLATLGDFLCEKLGLRFVVVDRPGMGGSTDVDVSQRIAVWLETVPVLMKELNVEHVSIFSHSCGVIYALNTIYAFPEILLPSNPTIHLFSPWVHPQQSEVKLMAVSSMLPSPLINHFNSVLSFVNQVAAPLFNFSGSVLTSASGVLPSSSPETTSSGQADRPKHERDDLCREFQGVPAADVAARSNEMMRRIWKENTSGANGEALLSLKKPRAGSWRVCDDYAKCPGELEARITQHFPQHNSGESGANPPPLEGPNLCITVFWAETDAMIGKKGAEYFDKCFKDFCGEQSSLKYRSDTVAETDHETLCDPQYGALPRALHDITTTA